MLLRRLTILARGISRSLCMGEGIEATDIAFSAESATRSCVKILISDRGKESVSGLRERIEIALFLHSHIGGKGARITVLLGLLKSLDCRSDRAFESV